MLALGLVASVALHGGALSWTSLQKLATTPASKPLLVEFLEPPKPVDLPKPVEPPRPKLIDPPVKVAAVKPRPAEPPRPIEEVREPPKDPPPVHVGLKLEASPTAAAVPVPVTNTPMGPLPKQAPNPADVKPYAPKPVAPGTADEDPRVEYEFKIPYPDEARRAGVDGIVRLRIVVDADGRVVEAKVLSGPEQQQSRPRGHQEVPIQPASKDEQPVTTSMLCLYNFSRD